MLRWPDGTLCTQGRMWPRRVLLPSAPLLGRAERASPQHSLEEALRHPPSFHGGHFRATWMLAQADAITQRHRQSLAASPLPLLSGLA